MLRPLSLALVIASFLPAAALRAHEIPADITAHLFVKPAGQRVQILVRIPLKAIRDVEFPQTAGGYLDVGKLTPRLPDAAALWISNFIAIYENGRKLPPPRVAAARVSLASDRSFGAFNTALRHLEGPALANAENVVWEQVLFDVLLEAPIASDRSQFSIRPGLEHLAASVVTVLRFVPPGGVERAFEFTGDPGIVPLDPRWHQAAARFVRLGFFHILDGTDHLLFLLCLVIPFRRFRPLILVVTAFTIAHSITLISSAYDIAPDSSWFPPLVETLIAVSIVYMALENILGSARASRRWMVAFGFGLVHGFGFSFALRETLQFAGSHLLASLLAFNVGVELGQLLVLLAIVPALHALFRYVVAERMGVIILSALVAHTGWHWAVERWNHFRQFPFNWPAVADLPSNFLLWLALVLAAAGAIRFFVKTRRFPVERAESPSFETAEP
jgi:hypothetical protein